MDGTVISQQELPSPPAGRAGWPWVGRVEQLPDCMPDGGAWPRLCIVTPASKSEFLEAAIRSVLLQGYPNLEYLVVDDGASDDSLRLIHKYEPWLAHWSSRRNQTQAESVNRALHRAEGDFATWLTPDDYYLPGGLAALATLARREPRAVAWAGACHVVDLQGAFYERRTPGVGTKEDFANAWFGAELAPAACLFSLEAFRSLGGLNEGLHYAADVDLWMRLAEVGAFATTAADVACIRAHRGMQALDDPSMLVAELISVNVRLGERAAAKKHLDRYVQAHLAAWPLPKLLSWLCGRGSQHGRFLQAALRA